MILLYVTHYMIVVICFFIIQEINKKENQNKI